MNEKILDLYLRNQCKKQIFAHLFIFAALPKLSTEDGKDSEKTNGKKTDLKNKTESNSGSGSDKTLIISCTSSNLKDVCKEQIEEKPNVEHEKDSMVFQSSDELKNNNRNGFNNSFHERVLINNTSLVTL